MPLFKIEGIELKIEIMSDGICRIDHNNIGLGQPKSVKHFNQQITNEFNQNVEIFERELLQLKAFLNPIIATVSTT